MLENKQFNVVDEAGNLFRVIEYVTVLERTDMGGGRSKLKTGFPIARKTKDGREVTHIDGVMTIIDGDNKIPVKPL